MITWIVSIYIGFVALLSPILPHKDIVASTTVPVTIHSTTTEGVSKPGSSVYVAPQPVKLVEGSQKPLPDLGTSLINPNFHYMDVENTPAEQPEIVAPPAEDTGTDPKPAYITPTEPTPGHVNGDEYSTGAY